jgi:hypothetical protein
MPRQETILQLFVASPSDLIDERAALEDVIRELNSTWSRTLGCRLDLGRWETHAVPGIGRDAQDVVNRSVPQDCDIFIGMLWSRFGTPTSRAESGTQEEFDTALKRYRHDPNSVRIVFYFKDEPLAPSKMDPEQLRQIQNFWTGLGTLGGLYWKFNTVEEFQNLVRVHLSRVVQDWEHTTVGTPSTAPPSQEPPTPGAPASGVVDREQEDEEGLLDLIDQANDAFTKLTELVGRMTAAIEEIGEKMAQRTQEIQDLHPERGSYDVKAAKRIAARAAADLTEYAARTEIDVPIFADTLATAMASLGRAASISMEFDRRNTGDLEGLLGNAQSLRHSLTQSAAHLQSFRESIAGMPRVTSALNKAKRTALSTMAALLREFEIGTSHVSELEQSLQQIIQRFDGADQTNG